MHPNLVEAVLLRVGGGQGRATRRGRERETDCGGLRSAESQREKGWRGAGEMASHPLLGPSVLQKDISV